jgi:hypothetical protein
MIPLDAFAPLVEDALRRQLDTLEPLLGPFLPGEAIAVTGWATVELDRAERELCERVPGRRFVTAVADPILGARARVEAGRVPGLVLLEPFTEGRLAASLARFGEGPVALYLVVVPGSLDALPSVAAGTNVRLSLPAPGPFGPSVLLAGARPWGPHLLLVEPPQPDHPSASGAGTIGSP